MGLFTEGIPLSWEETKALAEHVREHGITQFINLYHRLKDRQGDVLKWGDEVEYIIVKFDEVNRVARVSLKAEQLLNILNEKEMANPNTVKSLWRPEYGAFMIESSPGKPYGALLAHLNLVEANMSYRRKELSELLNKDECVMSITNYPRLGTPDFTYPHTQPNPQDVNSASRSLYFPDEAIYPGHPRYKTVTRNILCRRGGRTDIKLKVFHDENTKLPLEGSPPDEPDMVTLDAMGLGMGCCCLQVTFQACNITEARTLYDQLAPLCPLMLALTAATPIYKGYLVDSDCRWKACSSAVDCRTDEEKGLKPLQEQKFCIAKSRYDSIDCYLSPKAEKYNDVPVTYEAEVYKRLRDGGIDHLLAQHVAHLFIRDTVSLFSERVHQNDEEDTDHFENIQTTNWQTLRFKPPPPNSSIGWRVEFRPCEAQITDFENAAIVCFMVLVTRVILSYELNFLMPISKVDDNMKIAQKRNAVQKEKFWFRKTFDQKSKYFEPLHLNGNYIYRNHNSNGYDDGVHNGMDNELELMSIGEIFNGKTGSFPGLIPLIRNYLKSMEVDADSHFTIEQYLQFIEKRAAGELLTNATWIRNQVLNHPDYKKDSLVTELINYDLLKKIQAIQEGQLIDTTLQVSQSIFNQNEQISSNNGKDFIPLEIKKHLDDCNKCR